MMNLRFIYPWVLHLIWLAPIIGFLWLIAFWRGKRKLEELFYGDMRRKLRSASSPARFYRQSGILLAALTLIIAAGARPQWGTREEKIFQRGRDLVIALDVSRSMLAGDVRPSRLERAKADIMDLLKELRGDRAALVVFRGKAVRLCPLTIDYSFLEHALDGVTIDSAPPGPTNIGDGIMKALEAFEDDEGSHKAIILISDGEDLSESIQAAIRQARNRNIPIFTIGLGSTEGATIPDVNGSPITYRGEEVITRLEHEAMKEIAHVTGGVYVPVGTANVRLGPLYRDHLSEIAARDIEELIQERHIERYRFFLFPALILVLLCAFFSKGRPALSRKRGADQNSINRTAGSSPVATCILLLSILCAQTGLPDDTGDNRETPTVNSDEPELVQYAGERIPTGRDGARMAYRLYKQGKYKEAAEAYMRSGRDASRNLHNTMLFNAACALYKAGEYEAAGELFRELMNKDIPNPASAIYNLGCSLYRMVESETDPDSPQYTSEHLDNLEKAGQAFQNALRLDPDNLSAKANLASITNILPIAREQVKIRELMQKYGDAPPFMIAGEILTDQRAIKEELAAAVTNVTPDRINLLETLGERQAKNADLLIPLKPALLAAADADPADPERQRQLAMLNRHIEALRNIMLRGSEQMRDLDDNAAISAAMAENGIYGIWRGAAPYTQLLQEDIRRQAGAISMTGEALKPDDMEARKKIQVEQDEARELTELFTERFAEASARELESAASLPLENDSEEQRLTEETREKILALAEEAAQTQKRASRGLERAEMTESLENQMKSLELLEEIRKLLPEDRQQPDEQPDAEQDRHEDGEQDTTKHEPPNGEREQPPDEHEEQPEDDPEKDPSPEPDHEPEPDPRPETEQEEMTEEQAQALLERARQREKEHKREKMLRSFVPPAPTDKDW